MHASLLPRWRGAAPIQQAILAGDSHTGICLMAMEIGLDTGPVYASRATEIADHETAGELHDRLATIGGELLVDNLQAIVSGNLAAEDQDDSIATYADKIKKADARIDWNKDALHVVRQIRAYNPTPGAAFEWHGEMIKCWRAEWRPELNGNAGKVMAASKSGVDIACGTGAIRLLRVQRPGRNRISSSEFAMQFDLIDAELG